MRGSLSWAHCQHSRQEVAVVLGNLKESKALLAQSIILATNAHLFWIFWSVLIFESGS
jgi:hypothetical protein